jgi:uncharacterized protein (TIGR02452 family)
MTSGGRREALSRTAAETLGILVRGGYRAADGTEVDLGPILALQDAGTRYHAAGEPIPAGAPEPRRARIAVTDEDAVTALVSAGDSEGAWCCLVFASARRPGGGFLTGANAQEESLARATTLHRSLERCPEFHARHRTDLDLAYSDALIVGPGAVIRDAAGNLLGRPVRCAFVTAAAPNLEAMRGPQPRDLAQVPAILARRAGRILDACAAHGHRRLVLGAWGCGVFGNDPAVVAEAFRRGLAERPFFEAVTFAVPNAGSPQHRAFASAFGRA